MKTDTRFKILKILDNKRQARAHDLGKILGISQVAVHKQLKKLLAEGLISKAGTPPFVIYLPKKNARIRQPKSNKFKQMSQNTSPTIQKYLKKIKLPQNNSHKGQNGKLLIIGGSELFHAASKWSLDVASKFVDMLFYSSVPDNNELIKEAKGEFWNGIVVPRGKIKNYLLEADCVLIGPGMERDKNTKKIVNHLLSTHSNKKWVVDAGALQMVKPDLLNKNCIITPHQGELERIWKNLGRKKQKLTTKQSESSLLEKVQEKLKCTILLKGSSDIVSSPKLDKSKTAPTPEKIIVSGGNPGMTKGGTGDVLSGLVASLYCTHEAVTSAVVGSYINKKAGDELYKKVGPYFNTSDLVGAVPSIMWKEIARLSEK